MTAFENFFEGFGRSQERACVLLCTHCGLLETAALQCGVLQSFRYTVIEN